jgi:Na+/H+ antiporter NhaD/arsenite permease-like protein
VLLQGVEPLNRLPHALVTTVVAAFMLGVAALAYRLTKPRVRAANQFTFHPIMEVAIIFAGIFATMTPALDYLEAHAADLGIESVGQFYWGTGLLSAVLDNAPTYLNFLAADFGLHGLNVDNARHMQIMLGLLPPSAVDLGPLPPGVHVIDAGVWHYVQAISVAAVFFGAMTYIGNGPNFMVRSIAEHQGVPCPSFFGYVFKYSIPILLPLFFAVYWLYFRY